MRGLELCAVPWPTCIRGRPRNGIGSALATMRYRPATALTAAWGEPEWVRAVHWPFFMHVGRMA